MDLKIIFIHFFMLKIIILKKIIMNNYSFSKLFKKEKISDILYAQFRATKNVFQKKKIPFRSFVIKKRR